MTKPPIFALVDVNACYCAIERAFSPALHGRPLVVLSSNDGCVVARSDEAKALGIKMGAPWFQLQHLAKEHDVIALSSNYTLYADISDRAMTLLREFSPEIEVYSIDEAWLALNGMSSIWPDLEELGKTIRNRMLAWLGLPVCVGFGSTKTLSKLSNHVAKKTPGLNGVCDLTALHDDEVAALMATIDVGEVWGIGRRLTAQLERMKIRTVLDLRAAPLKLIRQHFGVTVERTCMELRGISCIELEEVAPVNQQIIRAKSFGQKITSLREVEEAVCTNLARAVDALRRQHLLCGALQVFVETDRFREDEPQYSAGRTIPLPSPSDDIRVLTSAAAWALRRIYKSGFLYKKGGVMLADLRAQEQRQEVLFGSGADRKGSAELMAAMEKINGRFGRDAIHLATAAGGGRWVAKAERMTQHFTTDWKQLPIAR